MNVGECMNVWEDLITGRQWVAGKAYLNSLQCAAAAYSERRFHTRRVAVIRIKSLKEK